MSDGRQTEPTFLERTIAAAHRARSLESRAGSLLALGVVCVLGFGLLAWYYSAALQRPARAAQAARSATASRTQSEMILPPLASIASDEVEPRAGDQARDVDSRLRPHDTASRPAIAAAPPGAADRLVEAAARPLAVLPVPPAAAPTLPWITDLVPGPSVYGHAGFRAPVAAAARSAPASARAPHGALQRRLSGPTFSAQSDSLGSSAASDGSAAGAAELPPAAYASPAQLVSQSAPRAGGSDGTGETVGAGGTAGLARLLAPQTTPAVAAQVLPTRTLLLAKGSFIDCTLETAIDSTLPGMTTCITATDTFGVDGKVVLLERGSKLVGETRGEVAQGSSRVFVLWEEARTPTGVVIPLASPGTDELGRSGLPGVVDRHFFERFGAALLISIIDTGAEAAAQSRSGTVIYSPAATQDVTTEVLKDTLRIPPTVVKQQGDRIQVLVARDLDFRSVYELRTSAGSH